jgi:preflagellin peptidase FlaK
VEAQDIVTALQIISSVAVLCFASVLDWRTRRVGNPIWMALSVLAVVFLIVRILLDEAPVEYLLILMPIIAILADVYLVSEEWGRLARYLPIVLYSAAILITIYMANLWIDDRYFAHLLTAPIMMVLIAFMYMLDLIRGGADAKALMALSLMFPFYPDIGPFPLTSAEASSAELLFPFAFVVLVTAAIIVALMPIVFAAKNLSSSEFTFPLGLVGYRVDALDAKSKQVWLMERMEDGVHRTYTRPRPNEDLSSEIDKLVAAGHTRAWVTPKIPFIIPITVALALTTIVGNILAIVMGL